MKRCEEIWICYHLFPVFLVISPVFDASIRYVRRRRCFVYSISCTRPIADGCAFTSVLPAGHVGPQSPGKGLHAFRDSGTPNLNSTGRFSVTTFLAQKNSRIQPIWNWLLVKSGHVSRFWVFFVDILLPSSHIFPHLPTSSHIFPHLPTSSHILPSTHPLRGCWGSLGAVLTAQLKLMLWDPLEAAMLNLVE